MLLLLLLLAIIMAHDDGGMCDLPSTVGAFVYTCC